MKHMNTLVILGMAILCITSCKKELQQPQPEEISQEVKDKIFALGFGTSDIQIHEDGYLVEGDIVITPKQLNSTPERRTLRIAEVEQYHTFNLVTGTPRTITVSSSGNINSRVSDAINAAIGRYNAQNLGLTFQRVSSGGDINIKIVNGGFYIASAGFPDNSGDPYPEVKFNKRYQNYSAGFLTTVMAHEMGHCIGFRHTDYMDRSFSCGSGGNEGQETTGVGAEHISGTPTGPDEASWMLACLSSTTNREFNKNDKIALDYLY